ncbi:Y-family DNA polymerase [Paraglaciecola sp. 2405UD69-4]|uniref:Y-family DNA polymerase n=1 Tax=Paraglaciecola sp. 2405UD69-4 TaxID=3391836 RepID=UPI0039C9BF2E
MTRPPCVMQKLWLYLYFPSLQLDTLLQQSSDTDIHKQAYIIFDEAKNQTCQLNEAAYQAGIRLGMGLGTASMLKADLQVIPYQENITKNRLNNIAQNLYLATSDICFFSHNGLLLRVHNMLNLYGDLVTYWQHIKHILLTQNVHFHYATGHSPLAAKLLAVKAWDRITDSKIHIEQAMSKCTLQHTELSPKSIQKLNRVGIHDVEGLLKLPLADIAKRFEIDIVTYIGRLTAELSHPVNFFHPKPYFDQIIELLFDVQSIQILQKPLLQLLAKLELFLKERDLLTQSLKVYLSQREHNPIKLEVNSQQGEYLAKHWEDLLFLKLENISLESPIFAIQLIAPTTYVRRPDKQDLFAGKQGSLSPLQLRSILQAKLGKEAILTPQLADDYRPERTTLLNQTNTKAAADFPLFALRPSFLLTPPQPLQEKVHLASGPERIETGWWDSEFIIRDYFIAYNALGQWYWVFKTPHNKWYLHGVFS